MARTPFEVRKQAGGTYALVDESRSTGNYFYVSSVTGKAGNSGLTPDSPLPSLVALFASASGTIPSNDNGDVIICMPGHTEAMIAAGTLTLGIIGCRIVGLGYGNDRPTITFTTAAAASILVSAANCSFENFIFDFTGVATLTNGIQVQAAGFALRNCLVILANATNQAAIGISATAAANRMVIENNQFTGTANGTTTPIQLVGGSDQIIRNNTFQGFFTAGNGAISGITTAGVNLVIFNNVINNGTASSTKAINIAVATTGQVSENKMQILSGTAPIGGAALSWVGANYYAATIATAGTLI